MGKKLLGIFITLFILSIAVFTCYDIFLAQLEKEHPKFEFAIEKKEQHFQIVESEDKSKDEEDTKQEVENLNLYANAAALMDGETYRVLYEMNGYEELPMASTTKIMTCIVTLENANLKDTVTISKYASTMPDVQLNVIEGDQFYLKDLLYSLMLESHNDVAVAIAEHVGGSVEGFAKLMNEKAKELGCKNTNFVTPNGLDAEGHHTTAVELAKIASYAITNKDFIDITNTPSWKFNELKSGRTYTVTNMDRFLYLYDGAIGIKTGFTNKAGYCFVGAVKKGEKTFVTSVLQCGWPPNRNYKWVDTTNLMDFGIENYEIKEIFKKNKVFDPVYVEDGKEQYVDLHYDGELSLLVSDKDEIKVKYTVPRAIQAPVVAETMVGNAKYYINGEFLNEFPIYTSRSIEKIDFNFCFEIVKHMWMLK